MDRNVINMYLPLSYKTKPLLSLTALSRKNNNYSLGMRIITHIGFFLLIL